VPSDLWLALLLSLRGSAGIYQGEELGLPEAEVPFELLQDPYGRAFWPEFKGRDGCRTPMPWRGDDAQGGFTTGAPWLPMSPAHLPLAVNRQQADPDSMLAFSRSMLHWRRAQPLLHTAAIAFFDAPEPVLWFERREGARSLQAVFNLGPAPMSIVLRDELRPLVDAPLASSATLGGPEGRTLALAPFGAFFGEPAAHPTTD